MKPSLLNKLRSLVDRHQELSGMLADPATINDQNRFREISKEYAQLEPVVACFQAYEENTQAIENAGNLIQDSDAEMRELAQEELKQLKQTRETLENQLQTLLLPIDPNDERNVYLEIRGGAGGDEAAIFAGDLFRMYAKYAESQRWALEIISESPGEHGGYKQIVALITGNGAYSKLKFESGAHRVQRVPETEAQGRVHTSTCTVAILPEVDSIEEITINPADLRVDTFRASGAGGQHVNRTESAIRITHIPTGVVVECQDERSQHKNRARAMKLLQSKLLSAEQEKQAKEQAQTRRSLVGTGDRSERIRTYNFPQGRVTDHRINLTLYQLDQVIQGSITPLIEALNTEHQADLLAQLGE